MGKERRRRHLLLKKYEEVAEWPMLALAVLWIALIILDLVQGLSAQLANVAAGIWVVFIFDFVFRFWLSPRKLSFLIRNWLLIIALVVPALRIFRIAQVVRVMQATRAAQGVQLVQVVTSANRGLNALGRSLGRKGAGYVSFATVTVIFLGAAGMLVFERPGIGSYPEALWWTAMLLTTLGSDYWPQTNEGRLLTVLLSTYALGIFGYVAGLLASFFVESDAAAEDSEVANDQTLRTLREEIRELNERLGRIDPGVDG
jgi:voltage-gated potassium channel